MYRRRSTRRRLLFKNLIIHIYFLRKSVKIESDTLGIMNTLHMDYTKLTNVELKNLCKHRGITGYSTRNKSELIGLLSAVPVVASAPSAHVRYIDLFY